MAQDIATQGQMNLETPTSGLRLSDKLSALVRGNENPIVGPKSAAELRAFAAQPELATATQGQVDTMLAKLALATAAPKVSDDEARERLELYWLALKDLPVEDLRAAFMDLIRTAKFLPTPAEVRQAAVQAGLPRVRSIIRAKHLAYLHDRHWKPPIEDLVDPAEVRAFLGRHCDQFNHRAEQPSEIPTEGNPHD